MNLQSIEFLSILNIDLFQKFIFPFRLVTQCSLNVDILYFNTEKRKDYIYEVKK